MTTSPPAAQSESESKVCALLSRLEKRFADAGVDSPGLDARLILAMVLGCDRVHLHAYPEKVVPHEALAKAEALARRREAREPMAYILGEREFWSMSFSVSPDVLIPRPESELLVERAVALLREKGESRILDVGCGSGAVGLAVASELTEAHVTLLDLCPKALEVARRNAEKFGLNGRTRLVASDLFQELAEGEEFDLIVSNPPYVATGELDGLMPEISSFEPRIALDGGADGMDLIRCIIEKAPAYLAHGGSLLIEMDPRQMAEAEDFSQRRGNFHATRRHKDLAGRERVLELQGA